jgi:hypothetical protein
MTMSSAIGQAITSRAGAKLAAGGLIGALALGGGTIATGQQSCDTATVTPPEVTGHMLVETDLDEAASGQTGLQRIEVEGLGVVDVAHSGSGVEVIDLRANDGGSAEVRSQGQNGAEIDFTLGGVTRTLLVSLVDGRLVADLAPPSVGDATASVDGTVDAEGRANGGDAGAGAGLDADADTGLSIEGDADADGDVAGDAQGEIGILGGIGIDLGFGD